jgi:hypothetical protein
VSAASGGLFETGPAAPFTQRASIPDPGRSSRRLLAFGYVKGPLAGVRAPRDVAEPLLDLLSEGRRKRLDGDALLAGPAAAMREEAP